MADFPRARRRRQGFSLLELLLTVVLILLLLGAMAFNFSTMSDEAVLRESAGRVGTLIHLSRAHAATTGRRVQIAFQREPHLSADPMHGNLWSLAVLWEPDPLVRPYYFEPLPAPSWDLPGINQHIGVESVVIHGDHSGARLFLGTTAHPAHGGQTLDETNALPPILFYPDGSSDSASVTLASRSEQDRRRIRLDIQGLTGAIGSYAIENRETVPRSVPGPLP